jgi:hypothetical protein
LGWRAGRPRYYWILLSLICLGCGGAKQTNEPKKPPKEKPIIGDQLPVNLGPGDAMAREKTAARDPLYHVKWQSAVAQASDNGIFAGSMEGVTGEMYNKGQIANTFKADHARAERATDILTLTDHVQLDTKETVSESGGPLREIRKATLTCDKLEWHGKEKYVVATGNVKVLGTYGALTGLNEVWATPDLKTIASPSMFKP